MVVSMTQTEALRLALKALESGIKMQANGVVWVEHDFELIEEAITAVEAALEAKDEPVAWISAKELLVMRGNAYAGAKDWRVNLGLEPEEGDVALYTQPQRKWAGLTRIELIRCGVLPFGLSYELYEAIEAKLKEKNT
jgi:hypothetical protein